MRYIHVLVLLILMLNSCSGQDYSIETKQFDCLVKTSKELGVDLKKELSKFENELIKAGVLSDNSGESYYQIYKTIEETGDINFTFQYSFLDSVKANIDSSQFSNINTDCMKYSEKLEKGRNYKKSKIYQLKIALDSIRNTNSINVSAVASVILRVLSPKDFEQDYYRMTALLMLASTQDTDSGLIKRLPPMPDDKVKEPVEKRNLLLIYVSTDNDSVKVNGKRVSIDDLTKFVKSYIISDSKDTTMPELICKHIDLIGDYYQSKLIISLSNDKKTKYDTYIKVQNQLLKAYELARNDMSKKYFNKQFIDLTDSEKNAIKELVPLRISEAEPEPEQ